MASNDDEKLLRSVMLQDAQSILAERQRAERELIQTKEALELTTREFAHSLAMMRATLESTTDGILVTDGAGNVTGFNQKYVEMWRIPLEIMNSREQGPLIEASCQQFKDPRRFLDRIEDICSSSPPESYDLLELADGRVFERFSKIQSVGERNVGRVWGFRDITERRRTEEALQSQAEWLRVTLFSIGDGVITTGAEGVVTSLNPVAESLTGWTLEEARGKPLDAVFRIVNEHSHQPVGNPATRALREGGIVGLARDTVLVAKDGTERAIDDSAAPIRDETGHASGVVLIFRDVTEARKAAEEHLRLSAIVESSDDAIIGKTLDGIIVSWNRGAERLYGYSGREVVGKPISILIPPGHPDELPEIMGRLKRGERIEHFETQRLRKDGTRVDVSLTISPIKSADGRIIGASKIARDITASKRAEQTTRFMAEASATLAELSDGEGMLEKIASIAVPFFADWSVVDMKEGDGSLRRLSVTHAAPAKVQASRELGRRYPPCPSDSHGAVKVLRTGQPDWMAEIPDSLLVEFARDEEHLRLLRELGFKSYICVPVQSRETVLGALTFVTGESGRIYNTDDVRAAEDLARRAAIAVENMSLLAALRESDRRKDEFLAMLAHELRNPLAPIRNAVKILQLNGSPLPDLQWARDVIDRQVQQMTGWLMTCWIFPA